MFVSLSVSQYSLKRKKKKLKRKKEICFQNKVFRQYPIFCFEFLDHRSKIVWIFSHCNFDWYC